MIPDLRGSVETSAKREEGEYKTGQNDTAETKRKKVKLKAKTMS